MNKEAPEYERVREEIAKLIKPNSYYFQLLEWADLHEDEKEGFRREADQILSTKGIAILADEQELPVAGMMSLNAATLVQKTRRDMLKANFKKVI